MGVFVQNVLNGSAAALAGFLMFAGASVAAPVNGTGDVTPDVIFGSGNANGSFTGATAGDVELALRAKLRYDLNGVAANTFNYDGTDTYTFDSSQSTTPANRSLFNFEWSISTLTAALDTFTYLLTVDTDPTVNVGGLISYDPLGLISTGYYLGTALSGNGGAAFQSGGDEDFSQFTVAQNSVNMGFLSGAPLGSGQFTFTLSAFRGTDLVNSTSIDVIVDAPAPIPLPAAGFMLLAGLGGLAMVRRRRKA